MILIVYHFIMITFTRSSGHSVIHILEFIFIVSSYYFVLMK